MLIAPKTWEDNANVMEIWCVNLFREVGDNSLTYANIMEDNSPTYAK
jgi:hypothetical protein